MKIAVSHWLENTGICTYNGSQKEFFTKTEIVKLHRHFRDPASEKIWVT